jgi:hypothetical protein
MCIEDSIGFTMKQGKSMKDIVAQERQREQEACSPASFQA